MGLEVFKHPHHRDIYVSKCGRVFSEKSGTLKELKQSNNGTGYLRVGVGHSNPTYVHVLVAETFHGVYRDLEVNHIDGDKSNNYFSNLEWATKEENIRHSWRIGLRSPTNETPVMVVETGEVFRSQAECARAIGGIQGNIALCLSGRRKSHRGYTFAYAEEGP